MTPMNGGSPDTKQPTLPMTTRRSSDGIPGNTTKSSCLLTAPMIRVIRVIRGSFSGAFWTWTADSADSADGPTNPQ